MEMCRAHNSPMSPQVLQATTHHHTATSRNWHRLRRRRSATIAHPVSENPARSPFFRHRRAASADLHATTSQGSGRPRTGVSWPKPNSKQQSCQDARPVNASSTSLSHSLGRRPDACSSKHTQNDPGEVNTEVCARIEGSPPSSRREPQATTSQTLRRSRPPRTGPGVDHTIACFTWTRAHLDTNETTPARPPSSPADEPNSSSFSPHPQPLKTSFSSWPTTKTPTTTASVTATPTFRSPPGPTPRPRPKHSRPPNGRKNRHPVLLRLRATKERDGPLTAATLVEHLRLLVHAPGEQLSSKVRPTLLAWTAPFLLAGASQVQLSRAGTHHGAPCRPRPGFRILLCFWTPVPDTLLDDYV